MKRKTERDGAELAELRRWKEEAVLSCARKRCGQREARIAELDAEVARLTTQLHRREADLLAQMNTNIEVGNLYDAALARAEAAERDAARYRWLRTDAYRLGVMWPYRDASELDAAIDAAIAKEQSHASE